MNKEILKIILNTPSMEFSYEEIQTLLDGELEKTAEEMDTDLVELCIEVLSRKNTVSSEKKETEPDCDTNIKTYKKRNVRKILLVAAIVSILSLISVSVSANVFNIEVSDGFVNIFGKQISLNLTELHHKKVLAELEEQGFKDTYLLSIFTSDNCQLELSESDKNRHSNLKFNFIDSDITGYITIRKYDSVKALQNNINIYSDVEQIKQINIDGTDLIMVSTPDSDVIVYYNTESYTYCILFEASSIDEIVDLLK